MSHADRRKEREEASGQFLPPLTPRPRLFALLLAVLAVWIACLVTLYFTTVVPRERQLKPATTRGPSAEMIANPGRAMTLA